MVSGNDDAEIGRLRAMTDREIRAYFAAQGRNDDVAKLNLVAQLEMVEKALFGATLDDIMNFTDPSRLPSGEEEGTIGQSSIDAEFLHHRK
jgi:hypothetical protein